MTADLTLYYLYLDIVSWNAIKKTHDHIQFQMSNLTIIILHEKHANLLNLAILKLQKQPCFCSCVLKSKKTKTWSWLWSFSNAYLWICQSEKTTNEEEDACSWPPCIYTQIFSQKRPKIHKKNLPKKKYVFSFSVRTLQCFQFFFDLDNMKKTP